MKTVAIIQARMRSTRLPGKVLADVAGKPLLLRVIDRAKAAGVFDDVIVATSNERDDDPVVDLCQKNGVSVFRGSENDVLDRFFHAAEHAKVDVIARVTADCPLLDPVVTKEIVEMFRCGRFDYVSNVLERTFPDGLDVEVFDYTTLLTAHREAKLPSEREHVTPYIHKHPEMFRLGHFTGKHRLTMHRWTVDEPRDLQFVRAVYEGLGKDIFSMEELLSYLQKHPELSSLNKGIETNEGMKKSYEEDARFLQSGL